MLPLSFSYCGLTCFIPFPGGVVLHISVGHSTHYDTQYTLAITLRPHQIDMMFHRTLHFLSRSIKVIQLNMKVISCCITWLLKHNSTERFAKSLSRISPYMLDHSHFSIFLLIHGRSKWSCWSGFYGHFWNCACADNESFALAQLHWAITRARTTPWLQRMNDQDPRKATSSVNISFQSAHLGKRKQCPCLPICLV